MLTHTRPQVRKQTVLVLWRIVRSWPEVTELSTGREERGEDPWMERLRERLGDDDMGVVSATVNLICELARKDPKTYLPLAPELFGLLTASTNNWMLIKIIKLVCSSLFSAAVLSASTDIQLTIPVCRFNSSRASISSQTCPSSYRVDRDDSSHVTALRMYSNVDCRRNAQR